MTLEEKLEEVTKRVAADGYQSLYSFIQEHLDEDDLNNILEIYEE